MAERTRSSVEAECRRIEEDTNHSSRGHFVAASFWGSVNYLLGIPMVLASAVAGVAATKSNAPLTVTLTVAAAVLGALSTFLNPSKNAEGHLSAGNKYLGLRDKARIFRTVELPETVRAQDREALKSLSEAKAKLNGESPKIPGWAYWFGKKSIEAGQAAYVVDSVASEG